MPRPGCHGLVPQPVQDGRRARVGGSSHGTPRDAIQNEANHPTGRVTPGHLAIQNEAGCHGLVPQPVQDGRRARVGGPTRGTPRDAIQNEANHPTDRLSREHAGRDPKRSRVPRVGPPTRAGRSPRTGWGIKPWHPARCDPKRSQSPNRPRHTRTPRDPKRSRVPRVGPPTRAGRSPRTGWGIKPWHPARCDPKRSQSPNRPRHTRTPRDPKRSRVPRVGPPTRAGRSPRTGWGIKPWHPARCDPKRSQSPETPLRRVPRVGPPTRAGRSPRTGWGIKPWHPARCDPKRSQSPNRPRHTRTPRDPKRSRVPRVGPPTRAGRSPRTGWGIKPWHPARCDPKRSQSPETLLREHAGRDPKRSQSQRGHQDRPGRQNEANPARWAGCGIWAASLRPDEISGRGLARPGSRGDHGSGDGRSAEG